MINNVSALYQSPIEETETKKFDLAMTINTRATFLACKYCIPYLRKSKNPHILTNSPPISAANDVRYFKITNYVICIEQELVR